MRELGPAQRARRWRSQPRRYRFQTSCHTRRLNGPDLGARRGDRRADAQRGRGERSAGRPFVRSGVAGISRHNRAGPGGRSAPSRSPLVAPARSREQRHAACAGSARWPSRRQPSRARSAGRRHAPRDACPASSRASRVDRDRIGGRGLVGVAHVTPEQPGYRWRSLGPAKRTGVGPVRRAGVVYVLIEERASFRSWQELESRTVRRIDTSRLRCRFRLTSAAMLGGASHGCAPIVLDSAIPCSVRSRDAAHAVFALPSANRRAARRTERLKFAC